MRPTRLARYVTDHLAERLVGGCGLSGTTVLLLALGVNPVVGEAPASTTQVRPPQIAIATPPRGATVYGIVRWRAVTKAPSLGIVPGSTDGDRSEWNFESTGAWLVLIASRRVRACLEYAEGSKRAPCAQSSRGMAQDSPAVCWSNSRRPDLFRFLEAPRERSENRPSEPGVRVVAIYGPAKALQEYPAGDKDGALVGLFHTVPGGTIQEA